MKNNTVQDPVQFGILYAMVRLQRFGITDIFKVALLTGHPSHRSGPFRLAVSKLIDRGILRYGSSPRTIELTTLFDQINTTPTNAQAQQDLFELVTIGNNAPPKKLQVFWALLTNGRSHSFLQLTDTILGDSYQSKNTDIASFRGFRQMVQVMVDLGVVTWKDSTHKRETVRRVEKVPDGLLRLADLAFPCGRP